AGVRAQELVGGGELGADARGLAPAGLDRPLGLGAGGARGLGGAVGARERLAVRGHLIAQPRGAVLGVGVRLPQGRELALEVGVLVAVQALELGLELLDALAPRLIGRRTTGFAGGAPPR